MSILKHYYPISDTGCAFGTTKAEAILEKEKLINATENNGNIVDVDYTTLDIDKDENLRLLHAGKDSILPVYGTVIKYRHKILR